MQPHTVDIETDMTVYGATAEEIVSIRPPASAALAALRERGRSVPQEVVTTHPIPITVMVSFRLCPHHQGEWYSAWRGLANIAQRLLYCHRFDLLQDGDDDTRCLLLSEWDDRAAFNHFVRRTNLLWLERSLGYSQCPTEYTVFEGFPEDVRRDAETGVETVPSDAGSVPAARQAIPSRPV
jgi:quinol monooxygenase YgiN